MRNAFVQTLLEEALDHPEIVLITGDLGFGVLDDFQKRLPNQFINAGVAEQSMMSMAAGIASTGRRVFVYSIGNFPTLRCIEQIRNDVCLMNNPVVVVSVGAGYSYGPQGYTHHALEDLAVMRALPNIDICVPADSVEAKEITKYLIGSQKPAYLRIGKSGEPIITATGKEFRPYKMNEIKVGSKGTILFTGSIGIIALEAAMMLEQQGIDTSIASVPFISNLDFEYIQSAVAKGPIITVEEHSSRGGFGSALLEFMQENGFYQKVRIIASSQKHLSMVGSQEYLREMNGLSPSVIVREFLSLMAG
jgi:transketolase